MPEQAGVDPPGTARLRHEVPFPLVIRIAMIAGGCFAVLASAIELYRGIWPPNAFSLFFLVLVAGCWSVGFAALHAGLFGRSQVWDVTPGRVEIVSTGLGGRRSATYAPADILGLTVTETNWSDGGPSWTLHVATADGLRYESRSLESAARAEALKTEFAALMAAEAPRAQSSG